MKKLIAAVALSSLVSIAFAATGDGKATFSGYISYDNENYVVTYDIIDNITGPVKTGVTATINGANQAVHSLVLTPSESVNVTSVKYTDPNGKVITDSNYNGLCSAGAGAILDFSPIPESDVIRCRDGGSGVAKK